MALKLRLARGGSKKRPYYKIVVADARSPRDGRFIEQIGHYNPMLPKDSGERVGLKNERIQHWLDQGAQPTDRVLRFLDEAGLAKREARSNPKKGEPGAKAKERVEERKQREEERAAREAEEAEAKKQAEEEAKAAAAAESEASNEESDGKTDGEAEGGVADAVTGAAAAVAETVTDAASKLVEAVTGGSDDEKDADKKSE